jgi:hypothetical protein
VATTNMSIAAMSGRWLRRKLRQVGRGLSAARASIVCRLWVVPAGVIASAKGGGTFAMPGPRLQV